MDGGSSSRSSLWDQVVSQAVKYYGIRRLDYIFLSHDDQDHTSAVTEFLETYEPNLAGENVHGISVGALVLPVCNDSGDFASLILRAQECGIPVLRMDQGDVIGPENRENDWQLVCLSPSEDTLTGEKNQDSMVLKLCCGSFRMLFTGDLEKAAEQRLVQSGADLQADVLKVGHHGSAGASSEAFLEQVNAAVGLISCGLNNRYGHPAQAALERLEDAGCKLLRTDLSGAITIREDGQKITVYTNKTFVLK
jgi:competence protein ComEC